MDRASSCHGGLHTVPQPERWARVPVLWLRVSREHARVGVPGPEFLRRDYWCRVRAVPR